MTTRSEPARTFPAPVHEPQPAPVNKRNGLLAAGPPHRFKVLPQRRALNKRHRSHELLRNSTPFMRRVNNQSLAEQKNTRYLPDSQKKRFPVLPRDDNPHLESRPVVAAAVQAR